VLSSAAENVLSQRLTSTIHLAVNSKLFGPATEKHGGEHVEQTVDVWQIVDADDRKVQTQRPLVSEMSWSPVLKTTMDCHGELVLEPLKNSQPVQVIMHQ